MTSDRKTIEVEVDYDEGRALISHTTGLLELCMIWTEAARQVRERTGMDMPTFLDGMRELMEPIGPGPGDPVNR
jgi:hypothetical protein